MKRNAKLHRPTGFKHLPQFDGAVHQGCLSCPPVTKLAPMNLHVAVGFGMAMITKDGETIYSEPTNMEEYDCRSLAEFEQMAQSDPNHDWRLILEAPLRGREYQRQGFKKWVLIDSNMGFA